MTRPTHIYRIKQVTTQVANYVVVATSEREALDSLNKASGVSPLSLYVKVEQPERMVHECIDLGELPT